jgi:Mn-dependent DtxR family transcriptional regulator
MQVFGKFSTNFDMDYLVEHYLYVNNSEEEKITVTDLEQMLKKKRKSVAGTIFVQS